MGKYQGQTDVELSAEGKEQARLLAENFPFARVDTVWSSTLCRAAYTAQKIAERFSLTVNQTPALREIDFGAWEGLTYKEISERWPETLDAFWHRPDELKIPDGETFAQLQKRAVDKLNEIIAASDGKNVVIVAHGAINRVILVHALHMDLRYTWSIRQFNTAVNIINFDNGYFTVELINGTAHLGAATHRERT